MSHVPQTMWRSAHLLALISQNLAHILSFAQPALLTVHAPGFYRGLSTLRTRILLQDMLSTLQRIVDNGHGYAVDGDVFFDVKSLPKYGRLSGLTLVRRRCVYQSETHHER